MPLDLLRPKRQRALLIRRVDRAQITLITRQKQQVSGEHLKAKPVRVADNLAHLGGDGSQKCPVKF